MINFTLHDQVITLISLLVVFSAFIHKQVTTFRIFKPPQNSKEKFTKIHTGTSLYLERTRIFPEFISNYKCPKKIVYSDLPRK